MNVRLAVPRSLRASGLPGMEPLLGSRDSAASLAIASETGNNGYERVPRTETGKWPICGSIPRNRLY